jgi:threonine dehydrogenase-like Zn-dependent dehydrogenase
VGCAAVAGARLAGAARIIAIDLDAGKLAVAREFGATDVVDASTEDVVAAVQALTDGNGADVCIEAVGNPTVLEQAFYARDLAGTLVQVGVPTPTSSAGAASSVPAGTGTASRRGTSPCWSTSTSRAGSTSTGS